MNRNLVPVAWGAFGLAALAWLLTAKAAAGCSTANQVLLGTTCYPALADLHVLAGLGALVLAVAAIVLTVKTLS